MLYEINTIPLYKPLWKQDTTFHDKRATLILMQVMDQFCWHLYGIPCLFYCGIVFSGVNGEYQCSHRRIL